MSRILVLGLGNPLLGDDGAGLVMLEGLTRHQAWPDGIEFVDGGTWGLSLLPDICDADSVLVLDAVRSGSDPGTVVRGEDDAIPRWYSGPLSPHQIDLREVLAAAELMGGLPSRLAVVGIEPQSVEDLHVGLSPLVVRSLHRAVDEAAGVLSHWLSTDAAGS